MENSDTGASVARSRRACRSGVIFGEVLFDVFPGGNEVLGGAPFNVAWNLCGFGLDVVLVTKVGADARGERILHAMTEWGMDVSGVQMDRDHPTGVVQVTVSGGQPTFDIVANQAYDYIDVSRMLSLLRSGKHGILYHGTLAARSPASRRSLDLLRELPGLRWFVDVNLRPPWWKLGAARNLVRGASWAKVNDSELAALLGVEGIESGESEKAGRRLQAELAAASLVVTLGENGAFLLDTEHVHRSSAPAVADLVDTVGAGDAFSAVLILGICHGWPPEIALRRAVEFATSVCTLRGATTTDRDHYLRFKQSWGLGDG